MKKIITKLFSVLLAGTMLVSVTSCDLLNSLMGGNSSSTGKNPPVNSSSSTEEEPPVEKDYTITFHYDFESSATLDADGKASAYKETAEYTSKKGKRVSLTTAMKDMFAMDGYKLKGYSTTAWQKDGITADMDVYVLYEKLGYYTITFQNPDGSTISTLNKNEGEALTATEYPAASAVTVGEGYEFIGWDVTSIKSVTQSVTIKALQGISRKFEAETFKNAVYDNSNAVVAPTGNNYSGGQYVHCEYKVAHGSATVTWELSSEKDTSAVLSMALAHRANKYYYINECIQVFVNDVQVDVFSDSIFTVEGWNVDTNGDGTTGGWGKFEEINIANVALKEGTNTITIKTIVSAHFEIDYFTLKGDVSDVYMNPYNLTLNGARFKDGKTTAKIEASGGLPVGIIVNVPNGMKLVGWTDGTETWEEGKFIMPEKDITISPVFKEQMSPQKNVSVGEVIVTIDGVKDEAYEKINSVAGHLLGGKKNSAINGDVYMAATDNGVYVYVDVTDDIVAVRGIESTKETDKTISYKNDMIEFWFQYGDIHTKLQFDAFGLHVRSDEDRLAKTFARLDEVEYTTALKGDNNVEAYRASGAPTVSTATGYAVEFWLPLADEGENIAGTTMNWTLQINSISDLEASTHSSYGWQMKFETDMQEIEKIYKANFVATKKIEAESGTATYYDASGNATDAKVMMKPENTVFSGGAYAHYEYWSAYPTATIVYNINATADETLNLAIMLGHRAAEFNKINSVFKVYVNGTELVISDDHVFALEGWGQDCNGDGTKGAYNVFEDFNLGNITLQEGNNEIKFEISAKYSFEIDYFTLSGNTSVLAEESAA